MPVTAWGANEHCVDCHFYEAVESICRKKAPVIVWRTWPIHTVRTFTKSPKVPSDWACGEFMPDGGWPENAPPWY